MHMESHRRVQNGEGLRSAFPYRRHWTSRIGGRREERNGMARHNK